MEGGVCEDGADLSGKRRGWEAEEEEQYEVTEAGMGSCWKISATIMSFGGAKAVEEGGGGGDIFGWSPPMSSGSSSESF